MLMTRVRVLIIQEQDHEKVIRLWRGRSREAVAGDGNEGLRLTLQKKHWIKTVHDNSFKGCVHCQLLDQLHQNVGQERSLP